MDGYEDNSELKKHKVFLYKLTENCSISERKTWEINKKAQLSWVGLFRYKI